MMEFFNEYTKIEFFFKEEGEKRSIFLKSIAFEGKDFINYESGLPVSRVFLLGKPYRRKIFNKYPLWGEKCYFVKTERVKYAEKEEFIVEEENETVNVKTVFTLWKGNGVLSVRTKVKNLQEQDISLECVAPLTLSGIMSNDAQEVVSAEETDRLVDITAEMKNVKRNEYKARPKFYRVHNTWLAECAVEEVNLDVEGFRAKEQIARYGRVSVSGNGSQTTNRYLPLGLFEKAGTGYLMFEVLPEGSWNYSIELGSADEQQEDIFLFLAGKTFVDNSWLKILKSGEEYQSEEVKVLGAKDLDGLLEESTKHKRAVVRKNSLDITSQVIYNIFMQNCGPCPSIEKDKKWVPLAAELGADYYVVDAGWFDNGSTQAVGVWEENNVLYPDGVVESARLTRKNGMKYGIWVELQSVGIFCEDKNLLPEYCFFHINGIRPICNGRYQLNYAYKEVRDYADTIIKRIVDRYDVDYIKIDYNQTQLGNDCEGGSYTEGLAEHMRGYLQWFADIQEKYPNVIFETCASGGMMSDSNVGKLATVYSLSDQGEYYNYPYIIANTPLQILPEQAGVWCVPVGGWNEAECGTSDEETIMNMVNSFYGVMHLGSRIDRLNDEQKALVREGVAYYRSLAKVKTKAYPIMPKGFTTLGEEFVCTGLRTEEKIYLSIYNLSLKEDKTVELDLSKYGVQSGKLVYPRRATNAYRVENGKLICPLQAMTARSFEFDIKK